MDAYEECGEIGRKQDFIIRNGLISPAEFTVMNALQMKPHGESLAGVHSKTISELRKQTANSSVSYVIGYFLKQPQFSECFTTKALKIYTVRCIELCWLMNVQDPPMYMDKDLKPGSSFETTKYKPFTKAGKELAFVVWPALFLQDGGELLVKGVAQGK